MIFYGHTQDALCLVAGDLVHLCIKSRILEIKIKKGFKYFGENLKVQKHISWLGGLHKHRLEMTRIDFCVYIYILLSCQYKSQS